MRDPVRLRTLFPAIGVGRMLERNAIINIDVEH